MLNLIIGSSNLALQPEDRKYEVDSGCRRRRRHCRLQRCLPPVRARVGLNQTCHSISQQLSPREITVCIRISTHVNPRCTTPVLDGKADIKVAAAAVKKAASKFGKIQSDRAGAWVESVINSDDGCPTDSLLNEQLVLFEECLLDDEGGKCKELDAALSAFDATLAVSLPADATNTKKNLEKSKKMRAGARVKAAASKFGTIQKQVAEDWTTKAITIGAPKDGPSLMEQQLLLFGECQLTEDGKPECVSPSRPRPVLATPSLRAHTEGFAPVEPVLVQSQVRGALRGAGRPPGGSHWRGGRAHDGRERGNSC